MMLAARADYEPSNTSEKIWVSKKKVEQFRRYRCFEEDEAIGNLLAH